MLSRDPHTCINKKIIGQSHYDGVFAFLLETQWSKTEVSRSLHVQSNGFTHGMISYPDFLRLFGFEFSKRCIAGERRECVWRDVPEDFDLKFFRERALASVIAYRGAEETLRECGIRIPMPFSETYFENSGYYIPEHFEAGDGHHFDHHEEHGRSEDARFRYFYNCFTHGGHRGFVHHVSPKGELTEEEKRALLFAGFKQCDECPFLDFEPCYWRATPNPANPKPNDLWDDTGRQFHSINERYHRSYPQRFLAGLEQLIKARSEMLPIGWDLFPASQLVPIPRVMPSQTPETNASGKDRPWKYDVAISFAGPQRSIAEKLATFVKERGFSVFYDDFAGAHLWGADLPATFDRIYSEESRFCLMIISREYVERQWTNQERRAAIDRFMREHGSEYILPLRCDDAKVPGLSSGIGHVDLRRVPLEKAAELLIVKLQTSR